MWEKITIGGRQERRPTSWVDGLHLRRWRGFSLEDAAPSSGFRVSKNSFRTLCCTSSPRYLFFTAAWYFHMPIYVWGIHETQGCTCIHLVPILFSLLLRAQEGSALKKLKDVVLVKQFSSLSSSSSAKWELFLPCLVFLASHLGPAADPLTPCIVHKDQGPFSSIYTGLQNRNILTRNILKQSTNRNSQPVRIPLQIWRSCTDSIFRTHGKILHYPTFTL